MARVFGSYKVTLSRQIRERFGIADGDYVRLAVVEVLRKNESGEWVKWKVK